MQGFFSQSAATIGLLNAFKGKRHFKINSENSDLIEALVLASTKPQEEIPFESFIHEILFKKYKLIIGRDAARDSHLLMKKIDGSQFEDNEVKFKEHVKDAGFLRAYSDSTEMISAEVLM